ncbi:MAG TPA: hypothetical protein VKA25_08065, partial [Gemmatimonadales bacterium]|nr:hypothetical protein [Gemmatimonadales bacterium]
MSPTSAPDFRDLLVDLYTAATAAAAPGPALSKRLQKLDIRVGPRIWILSLGKAALPMAITAIEVLASKGANPEGG